MTYKLVWKKEAKEEFEEINHSLKKLVISQFKKLQESPQLGKTLGKKRGMDLSGYRKLYFNKKKHRIVYRIKESEKKVIIYAIGERDDMAVYKEVLKRIQKENK
jgi:mRNA-degrading endonuclease RelE of RelBE toxin-antitoxin system